MDGWKCSEGMWEPYGCKGERLGRGAVGSPAQMGEKAGLPDSYASELEAVSFPKATLEVGASGLSLMSRHGWWPQRA